MSKHFETKEILAFSAIYIYTKNGGDINEKNNRYFRKW